MTGSCPSFAPQSLGWIKKMAERGDGFYLYVVFDQAGSCSSIPPPTSSWCFFEINILCFMLSFVLYCILLCFIFIVSSLSKNFFYHTIITQPGSIITGVIFFKHALTRSDPPRNRGRGIDLRPWSDCGRGRRPGSGPPRSKGPPPHPSQPRGGRSLC